MSYTDFYANNVQISNEFVNWDKEVSTYFGKSKDYVTFKFESYSILEKLQKTFFTSNKKITYELFATSSNNSIFVPSKKALEEKNDPIKYETLIKHEIIHIYFKDLKSRKKLPFWFEECFTLALADYLSNKETQNPIKLNFSFPLQKILTLEDFQKYEEPNKIYFYGKQLFLLIFNEIGKEKVVKFISNLNQDFTDINTFFFKSTGKGLMTWIESLKTKKVNSSEKKSVSN